MEVPEPPPESERPLTRDDVRRLIQEHGGPEGLDLSLKKFEKNVDLSNLDLRGCIFRQAHLPSANLQSADLSGANLQETDLVAANLSEANVVGAHLFHAYVTGAKLVKVKLDGANLNEARLQNVDLRGAFVKDATFAYAFLHNIDWGDSILGEERDRRFEDAVLTYRSLKAYHTQAGMPDIAGRFYYREKEAQRKLAQQEKRYGQYLWLQFLRFFAGYGEKPFRILGWWLGIIILGTLLMSLVSLFPALQSAFAAQYPSLARMASEENLPEPLRLPYYALVSFTALGYGGWVDFPGVPLALVGPGFAGLGAILIGLFIAVLARVLFR